MALTESKIQYALYVDLINKGHQVVAPNLSWAWLNWEADLVSITKAGYLYEYEIKVSHSDFMADFKKRKHRTLSMPASSLMRNSRIPSRFWYVAPAKAVPLCVPEYAGLMVVGKPNPDHYYPNHRFEKIEIVKQARHLHHNKLTEKGIMAILRSVMFKYWNLASKLNGKDSNETSAPS